MKARSSSHQFSFVTFIDLPIKRASAAPGRCRRRSSSPLHPAAATARDTMRGGVLPARIEAQRSEAPSTMREVEHGVTVAGR
jgi:hypothetical protein